MYSLLIKDRDFPISVYLSYMMAVKGFTRTDAVSLLSQSAYKLGLRTIPKAPANNTVSAWRNKGDTPKWAVVSAMMIMEQFGKVPHLKQEWAFWAYAKAEISGEVRDSDLTTKSFNNSGKWEWWLQQARVYKYWYEQRSALKRKYAYTEHPEIAAKIIISVNGNGNKGCTESQLLLDISNDVMLVKYLSAQLDAGEDIENITIHDILKLNTDIRITFNIVKETLKDLVNNNDLSFDNISQIFKCT